MGNSRITGLVAAVVVILFLTALALTGCAGQPAATSQPPTGTQPPNVQAPTAGNGSANADAQAGPPAGDPAAVIGFRFDGPPRIYCCSAGYLGWSEIIVGTELPFKGSVYLNPDDPAARTIHALKLVFPSGKELQIPVSQDGAFNQTVLYDEEGPYLLYRVMGDGAAAQADLALTFAVAYRVELPPDTPTVQSVFGPQHEDMQANRMVAVPLGGPARFRVRLVDAAGKPAKQRNPKGSVPDVPTSITTDADGFATITFTPTGGPGYYDLQRLYPGLAVLSYTVVSGGGSGRLTGLTGGPLDGVQENGQWYYPLGEFLKRAYPLRFADGLRQDGPAVQLDAGYGSYRLTTTKAAQPAGTVLDRDGNIVMQVRMISRSDGPWLALPDLARLFDKLAWGTLTPDGELLIAAPEIP